jgi:hypothetical protein
VIGPYRISGLILIIPGRGRIYGEKYQTMAGKQTKQQQQPEVGVKCFKGGRLPAVKLTIDSLSFSLVSIAVLKKSRSPLMTTPFIK